MRNCGIAGTLRGGNGDGGEGGKRSTGNLGRSLVLLWAGEGRGGEML